METPNAGQLGISAKRQCEESYNRKGAQMHAHSLPSSCNQALELNDIINRWKKNPICFFLYCDYMCADLGMCMAHV